MRRSVVVVLILSLCVFTSPVWCQSPTATVNGLVRDSSAAVVPGAEVQLINEYTNVKYPAKTNAEGIYSVSNLPPGTYRIQVSKIGFKTIVKPDIVLNILDARAINFDLPIGALSETVTVQGGASLVDTESPAVRTVVDRQFLENLPLNGRSFQTLFQLTPGVVITPTNFQEQGQFSVNGQRPNANYFTVDGVGANVGIAAGSSPGQTFGGGLPALTASGGTNSLVSTGAVQEFAIQTSSYAPQFGRTPGGQISIVTKSGTNAFHGELFEYLRNDVFDANDWFANHEGLKRAELRQNDFGGTVGGPIRRDTTFLFFSYEGLRLRQPTTGLSDVPTVDVRNSAPAEIRPSLEAFPLPTGVDEGNGFAPGNYAFSNPSSLDTTSIRVDHHVRTSLSVFGRYNYAPSLLQTRGGGSFSLNTITVVRSTLQTLTLGVNYLLKPTLANQARFNWSRATASSTFRLDNFGGAVPLSTQGLFPVPFSEKDSAFGLGFFIGLNTFLGTGRNVNNLQRQLNATDDLSWQRGAHLMQFGGDYRRLTPILGNALYAQTVAFADVPSALALTTGFTAVGSSSQVYATYGNYSLYAQDTWRPKNRLTVTYGVRWDYNPAPSGHASNGLRPVALQGVQDLSTLSLAPTGTPVYRASLGNLAPRLGFAYQLRESQKTGSVIRGGVGKFYDLGSGPAGNVFFWFPFAALKFDSNTPFPLTASEAAPPPLTTNPPFSTILGFPEHLKLPYTYEWNLSFEQSLGSVQTLKVNYVGAAGHNLLRTDDYGQGLPSDFSELLLVTNGGYSKYDALQVEFRRRSKSTQVLASYSLSHSLDNVSAESLSTIPGTLVNPRVDYASSDFDIRHTASMAVNYNLPQPFHGHWTEAVFDGWGLDTVLVARTSPPVNVTVQRYINGIPLSFRPDLVPGVPLYLSDPAQPGGRVINNVQSGPNTVGAFSIPTDDRQGNFGRNALLGFPLVQLDLGVRRQFKVRENIALQLSLEGFNVFNHPNFASPASNLGTTSGGTFTTQDGFGVSQSMLNSGLQGGGLGSGFTPLYQLGGPRSLQLALKVEF